MKTLQNNYTTPEQSKQLLELGVPTDSADCYYTSGNGLNNLLNVRADGYEQSDCIWKTDSGYINSPCWSVGRLIEIWLHCNKFSIDSTSEPITIGLIDFSDNFIDDFIHLIKKAVGSKHIDFSKLED